MKEYKPGEWQWEALNDKQARSLIEPIFYRYMDKDVLQATIDREKEIIEADKAGK